MRWFGNHNLFEVGWRRVDIAAPCNLKVYQERQGHFRPSHPFHLPYQPQTDDKRILKFMLYYPPRITAQNLRCEVLHELGIYNITS